LRDHVSLDGLALEPVVDGARLPDLALLPHGHASSDFAAACSLQFLFSHECRREVMSLLQS
jgi:hypothetical protein